MSNLKQQGIKALIWDFSGKVATQSAGFIISLFLARLLEPEEFGLAAMIMVIIGMANVFSDVGLGSALIQRRKVLPIHYSSVFYFNIFAGLLLTLATYFSAGWIAAFYQNDALVPLTQVMSISFALNAFSSVQTTKLRKDLNYAALSKANLLTSFAGGVLGIWLAFLGAGVWSLVAQTLASGVIFNVLIWSMSRWKPSLLFSVKALIQLWGFGFRMFLAGFLDAVFTKVDFMIIGKLFIPVTLGYFQRAKSLNSLLAQYSSESFISVLFPLLSQVKNDLPRLQKINVKMMEIICFSAFFLSGGMYLLSEEIIIFIFGEKWRPSVNFFQILALSSYAYPVSAVLVNILKSRGNSKKFLHLEIWKKSLNLTNLSVLYFFGINSYLYGLLVVSTLGIVFNIIFAAREINLSIFNFIEPFVDQAIVAILSTVLTNYLMNLISIPNELLLISKSFIFLVLYFTFSKIFITRAYSSFIQQIISLRKTKNLDNNKAV